MTKLRLQKTNHIKSVDTLNSLLRTLDRKVCLELKLFKSSVYGRKKINRK